MDNNYLMSLALRFFVAGTVVVGISIAAEKLKNPVLAGILLMLPSVSIVSFYFVGRSMGPAALSDIVMVTIMTLPIWIVYIVSFYVFLQHMDVVPALIYSLLIFLAGAAIFAAVKSHFS